MLPHLVRVFLKFLVIPSKCSSGPLSSWWVFLSIFFFVSLWPRSVSLLNLRNLPLLYPPPQSSSRNSQSLLSTIKKHRISRFYLLLGIKKYCPYSNCKFVLSCVIMVYATANPWRRGAPILITNHPPNRRHGHRNPAGTAHQGCG